jgi:hypothetical protein
VTEGPLKADIANSLSGLPTIGADSASNWRPAVPMLQRLGATTARLAWDADVITNPKVGQALVKFAAALKEAGIAVEVETWPASAGKGIDDLLAAGGTTEVLAGEEAEKFLE